MALAALVALRPRARVQELPRQVQPSGGALSARQAALWTGSSTRRALRRRGPEPPPLLSVPHVPSLGLGAAMAAAAAEMHVFVEVRRRLRSTLLIMR